MDELMLRLADQYRDAIKAGDYAGAATATRLARAVGYSLEAQAEGVRWRKI